ncbi:hypothetical protein BH09BAC2_BH09BAC2_04900 [soil metagenome]
MKNIFTGNSLFVAIFTFIANFATGAPLSDSTLLASNKAVKNATVIASNVIYPEILEAERDNSVAYVEQFSNKRSYLTKIYNSGKEFFPKVITVLKQYDLPEQLKVLIAIESEFKSHAVSSAGAVGYWQWMSSSAKDYGLKVFSTGKGKNKKVIDERTNFMKSTHAAAKYLRDSFNEFGDILLSVASYNCGSGNVRKAIKRSGIAGANFWDIKNYLPSETRNYVMKFISLNVIFDNYEKFQNNEMVFTPQVVKQFSPAEAL